MHSDNASSAKQFFHLKILLFAFYFLFALELAYTMVHIDRQAN